MIQKQPIETPIEEIHRIRREISEHFGGDVAAIAEDAARRLVNSGRPIWRAESQHTKQATPDQSSGPPRSI